jgi:hypothetical protein
MNTKFECPYCKGTGELAGNVCAFCVGTGEYGLLTLPTGYYHGVDIVDCIDFTEFNALSDNNKKDVALIIAAGFVNMNQDNPVMIKLFTCFPEGTNTCTKLLTLIGG